MKIVLWFCVILFGPTAFGVKLPSSVKLCHKSDPNFNKCVGKNMGDALRFFKDGSNELGIPRLEPFLIPKLEILGQPNQPVSLTQEYTNMLSYGITISEIVKANYDMMNGHCYWSMSVLTPNVRMEADYKINGQLLVFPINGHGRCNVTLKNLRNNHQAWCERFTKKGKTHFKFNKYTMDMQVDEAHFHFPNIIPGNEQLSNEVAKTVDENSLDIFKDVKHGFETVWSSLHMQTANNVFARIAEDEIFLE